MLKMMGAGAATAAMVACGGGEEAAVSTDGKRYEGVTIRMLSQGGGAYEVPVTQYAKEFEELTGAKVEFDWAPWESLMPKLQADLASGSPQLDIFLNDIEFQYTVWPNLQPLGDLIEEHDYNMDGFFEPVYKYGGNVANQGKRFGIPIMANVAVIFYRTDMIDEFPTTWDGYDQLLADLKAETGKQPLGFAGVTAQLVKLFLARYWSMGDPLLTKDWQPLINSENGVRALTMLKDFALNYAPDGVLAWDNPDGCNAFRAGDVMVLESWPSFCLESFEQDDSPVKGKWSMAKYPEGGTGNFVQHNAVILDSSQNKDAAFEFIAYITDSQQQKESALEHLVDPARKPLYNDEELVEEFPWYPAYAEVLDAGKSFAPGVPQWLEMFIAVGEAASLALSEQKSPQEALDEVAAKWTELFEQNPMDFEYVE
jgi:multiple sugar transport system substrate-binding protein